MAGIAFRVRGVPGVLGVLAATALPFVSSLAAQERPAQPSGALPSGGTGLIAGQAIDPGTGKPVPEAMVALRVGGIEGPENPRVLADPQGRFVFINVPAGRYQLQGQKLGYVNGMFGQRVVLNTEASADAELSEGQILTDMTVPLWKYAVIAGTVVDEAGQPVVGVRVDALRRTAMLGEMRLVPYPPFNQTARTDDRGMYRLANLPPGEYAVAVPTTLTAFPTEIMEDIQNPGPVRNQAFFALGELGGPLGDPQNQVVGKAILLSSSRTPIPPAPAGSEIASVYQTTFSPDTPHADEATIIALSSGQTRADVNITLRPTRAARVSGVLMGPDGPIALSPMRLVSTRERIACSRPCGDTPATALTDSAGRFTFLGVPAGDYVITMQTGDPQRGSLSAAEPITVGAAGLDVTVTARRAARITGRFDFRGAKTAETDYVELFGQPLSAGQTMPPGLGLFVLSSRGSRTSFESYVPPGAYALALLAPPSLGCTAALVNGRDITDSIFVMGSDNMDLTVVCTDSAARLSGTVRRDSGATDPDVAVVVFPTERGFWSGPALRVRRLRQAYTDKSGAYALTSLPAGEYFVAAIPIQQSELWQDPKVLEALARSATRVTLGPGESRTADLRTVQIK